MDAGEVLSEEMKRRVLRSLDTNGDGVVKREKTLASKEKDYRKRRRKWRVTFIRGGLVHKRNI